MKLRIRNPNKRNSFSVQMHVNLYALSRSRELNPSKSFRVDVDDGAFLAEARIRDGAVHTKSGDLYAATQKCIAILCIRVNNLICDKVHQRYTSCFRETCHFVLFFWEQCQQLNTVLYNHDSDSPLDMHIIMNVGNISLAWSFKQKLDGIL